MLRLNLSILECRTPNVTYVYLHWSAEIYTLKMNHRLKSGSFFLVSASLLAFCQRHLVAQPDVVAPERQVEQQKAQETARPKFDFRPDNEGVRDLRTLYGHIVQYRLAHEGKFPSSITSTLRFLSQDAKIGRTLTELKLELTNPDSRFADSEHLRNHYDKIMPYLLSRTRPDRSPIGGARTVGTKDVLATTDLYKHQGVVKMEDGKSLPLTSGYDLVLWDNGDVDSVPYDQVMFMFHNNFEATSVYPSQAGVREADLVSYEEVSVGLLTNAVPPPIGKPIPDRGEAPVPDNGGPEGLVNISRLLSLPNRWGIPREMLWKALDPAQEEFTLSDVQAEAAKLDLQLDLKGRSLNEVQELNVPAIFLTSDDKRIVVLSQLDDEEAIVIDRGLTRIVTRDLLATRYGGQALVATSAVVPVANTPQITAEDPVRSLSLQSPDQVLTQTVKISNTGGVPLTLEVERPISGAEKADLSATTVAPGASVTLSLSLRWRSVLKTPTQNVLVFLKTNDPRRPRLPLGFKLSLPATPGTP